MEGLTNKVGKSMKMYFQKVNMMKMRLYISHKKYTRKRIQHVSTSSLVIFLMKYSREIGAI